MRKSNVIWLVSGVIPLLFATSLASAGSKNVSDHKADRKHQQTLFKNGWRPVWRDEFNGDQIRDKKWSHEVNCAGGGNNEQQCYTNRPENSYVEGGHLHIVAKEESFSGPGVFDDDPNYDPSDVSRTLPFTSARLRTKNKFDFKYGRVEVKAKVAGGQGMWPAIWMLPTDNVYGGWPQSGEIDIMEAVNLGVWPNAVHGTLHYGLKWPQWENHGQTFETDFNPADDFHVYAIEWEEDEIRWYVDGEHYQTQTSDGWYNYIWKGQKKGFKVANKRAPFDQKFHLILNLAAGGDWPGMPDSGWSDDREMLVDYVRVYQCKKSKRDRHYGSRKHSSDREAERCKTEDQSVEVNDDLGKPGVNTFALFSDVVEPLLLTSNGSDLTQTPAPGFWEDKTGSLIQSFVELGGRRGAVWDITFNGLSNVFLSSENMSETPGFSTGVELQGGSGWANYGEIEFRMRVLEASDDSVFKVKLDSGWPNLGEVVINAPALGKWKRVKVSVADLLANPNPAGGGVDLSNIQNLFVLEYSGTHANVQIDDIRLQCAVNTEPEEWQQDQLCFLAPKQEPIAPIGDQLDVYVDSITNWNIMDCCSGASISEVVQGDNRVLRLAYDSDPNTNTVTFFQSASPMDLSAFAGGTLEFDMYVVSPPSPVSENPWMIKVDCGYPCGTGDIPITQSIEGNLPTTGVWQHFSFKISDLVQRGLDLTTVDTPLVIFPSWGNQDGAEFLIDNVQWFTGTNDTAGDALPVDFENSASTYLFTDFEGGVARAVGNPAADSVNNSTNAGLMLKYSGAVYGGSTLALNNEIDFSDGSVISMKVWSARAVPVLLKLEGINEEVTATHLGGGFWQELEFDFTGVEGPGARAITLIFDLGVMGDAQANPEDWTFYFDDISIKSQ